METIGWMSIEGIAGKGQKKEASEKPEVEGRKAMAFERRYIDTNLFGYHYHTGLNDTTFPTEKGKNVSASIQKARQTLDLDYKFGCAPRDLWLNRAPYPGEDSLISWLGDEVLPAVIHSPERKDIPAIAIANTGTLRFDVFKGPFTKDTTYIISPFVSKFYHIKDVPFSAASKLLALLNNGGPVFSSSGLDMKQLSVPEQYSYQSDFITPSLPTYVDTIPGLQHPLVPTSDKPSLVPGYTTKDEAGTDGDDTLHEPISFYRVPNVIEARLSFPSSDPDKVDVVFVDFVQPWILAGLKIVGESYTEDDVELYLNTTLTDAMVGWIKENWGSDC